MLAPPLYAQVKTLNTMVHFLVTFVHTNWMQKDLELYLPFKVDSPLYKSKKNILIIGSMVLKTTGLISWFQRKNRF